MQELDAALSLASYLTTREKTVLRNRLDSLDTLSVLSIEELSQIVGRPVTANFWNPAVLAHDGIRVVHLCHKLGIEGVSYSEPKYPALLRETVNAPYMLYYRGNLNSLQEKTVSVVGSRRVCRECAQAAFDFARDASYDGCTVVSGNACGIDSFAHKGALASSKGATVAVLPCGIDSIVPSANTTLARHIIESGGALVSEYAPGLPVEKWRFVQRNRIIAALSPVTVVVEAPDGSGALITADFAVDFNRDVVFHRSCFCEEAKKIPGRKKLREKNVRTALSFVESGAPIIDGYADMVSVLQSAPGTRQAELFE